MLGIIVIAIPLLIYVIGALSVRRNELTHPDEFFVAYRKVGVTAFSSSSIAYAFQVSTVYPFLLWGASNFYFVPAVNTVCWGIGILLFYFAFNRYKHFIGQDLTLHGFLGKKYGTSVRVVASYLTIAGFLGYAIAETYFGSKVLLSVIENKEVFYIIVTVSLLFVFGYISYGGQVSSIRTDQLQLVISYVGVFGLMVYFLYLLVLSSADLPGALTLGLIVLSIYAPVVLLNRRFRFIRFNEEATLSNKVINFSLNAVISVLLILVLVISVFKLIQSGFRFNITGILNIEGFGVPGLLTLAILPLCWQFVDLTNWQRLLSVKSSKEEHDLESLHRNVRRGLLIYSIESPFTWMIFLFFGLLTVNSIPNFTFQDLLVDIPKSLIASPELLQNFLGYTFIVSVLSIMLSTVDSFLVGIIFTFVYDSLGRTRRLMDSKDSHSIGRNYRQITNAGKLFGLIMILLGVMLFVVFDKSVSNGGELFINLLMAFYSAQLSFFPLVIGILFLKKHPTAGWANASMIIGAGTGIAIGIYSVIWNPVYAWYPILVCLICSGSVYFLGLLLSGRRADG